MDVFRQAKKPTLLFWSLLLSLALLCAQGVKLHAHNLDHEHDNHHRYGHIHAVDEVNAHSYLSRTPFADESSHGDHQDDVVSESNTTPARLVKSSFNNVFAIAVFAFIFTLVGFTCSRQLVQRCRERQPILKSYYLLSPPLRAPPQH